jgi:phosphoglycerate dehydrogenase-like enzyme
MKPSAVIINTSRGNIIDEQGLYNVLASDKIAGAGLDVYANEPLPLDSPLLKLDNIVLTPHVSSQTMESLWRTYAMAIDIASDFFAGKNSPHILNPDYKTNAKEL